jgi:hypothetical protein
MKHIIHDWDDERSVRILDNCRRGLRPGGKVLLVEVVIGAPNETSFARFLDLEMLALSPGGRERTEAEFAALFEAAGLRLRRIVPTSAPTPIIEAVAR